MCQEAGVLLEYLPPYSPDFNPIEKSFSSKTFPSPITLNIYITKY